MAFDLEDAEQSTAEIDRARVLARAERDGAAFRRERAQELLRMLVGAVLAPHCPEHRPLERVGVATQKLAHASNLLGCETDL